MKTITVPITAAMAGRSVQSILRREAGIADSYISALKFRESGILLNGAPVRTVDRVAEGDSLSARIDDEGGANPAEPMEAALSFVYEDEYLAVLNKSAGMAVHGSLRGGSCTVANALAFLWGREQPFHPVNRLDRGTSGLMVIARSAYVHDRLRRQLHSDAFLRRYWAAAEGRVEPDEGRITLPIGSGEGVKRRIDPAGQPALTEYRVLSRANGLSFLSVTLRTGRTHQIRVHFAALGHPLRGDALYGQGDGTERPALHSAYLRFVHPITGETLELSAPLPEELQKLTEGAET